MTVDWDKVWGVRVFMNPLNLHHLAFPNVDCKQALALTSQLKAI